MIIAILLLSWVNSKCDEKETDSIKNCKDETLEDDKKHCCFIDAGETFVGCVGLTEDEYKNQDDYKKKVEQAGEKKVKVNKLDCNSNYLKFCLISLLVILI